MYRQNDPVPDDALTNGSPNSKVEERGDLLFLITCISYNARYAKLREVENAHFPDFWRSRLGWLIFWLGLTVLRILHFLSYFIVLFVKKDNKLFKVTKDHTLVNLLISTGELTLEEAKFHPKKNVLMKALGAVNPAEVDIFDVEKNIDGILLSSDGLTNMLSVEQIENVLKMDISLEDKAKKLIAKSNNRGGTDNISVALLECESGEE